MAALLACLVAGGCRFGFEDIANREGEGGFGDTDAGGGGASGDGGEEGAGGDGGMTSGSPDAGLMLPTTVTLAAGTSHTCALINGTVKCWGDAQYGQLGYANTTRIGDTETPSTVSAVNVGGVVVAITAGEAHTCALLQNGAVRCWGDNQFGQLGYGNGARIGDDETPASAGDVPLGALATAISAGVAHTCALTTTGAVRCWGDNQYGQLGYGNTTVIGDTEPASTPGDVPLGGTAIAVSAGSAHTCAVMSTGAVRCWGDAMYGQLGYGNTTRRGDNEPASMAGDVPLGATAIAVYADEVHTCAVTSTNTLRCWGDSMYGQLGYGNTTRRGDNEPASMAGEVNVGATVAEVELGIAHTCVRTVGNAVRCWGDNFYGALGYGTGQNVIIGDTEAPTTAGNVPVGGNVIEIAAGLYHTCVRLDTQAVRCWGDGTLGRLGYGNTTTYGDNEPASTPGNVQL